MSIFYYLTRYYYRIIYQGLSVHDFKRNSTPVNKEFLYFRSRYSCSNIVCAGLRILEELILDKHLLV